MRASPIKVRGIYNISQYVEITETYLARRVFIWFSGLIFAFGVIYICIDGITRLDPISITQGIVIMAICLPITFLLVRHFLRRAKREKRFSITQTAIEIIRWDRQLFHVEWVTVKSIDVQKWREKWTYQETEGEYLYYLLTFQEEFSPRTMKFEADKDFTKRKIECFLYFLAQFARLRNIPVTGIEKNVPLHGKAFVRGFSEWSIFQSHSMQKKWEDFNNGIRNSF